MKISFWLLPPESVRPRLTQQIEKLSDENFPTSSISNTLKCLPTFVPHITLVGGIDCAGGDEEAEQVGAKLQEKFRNFGAVPCRFRNEVKCCYTHDKANGSKSVVWNQCCVAPMETSLELMRAVHSAREVLLRHPSNDESIVSNGVNNEDRNEHDQKDISGDMLIFPPPLREPHFSFAYGGGPELCKIVKPPPNFHAVEGALYWTYPSSPEGVSQWKEICRIPLC